jgi:hypothetical protein
METKGYWDRRAERQAREAQIERELAASPAGRLEAAQRRYELVSATDAAAYTDADRAAALAELQAARAAVQAEIDAEWTRERTIARREQWNAAVKAGAITGRNGKVDWAKVAALQQRLGFTADALKAAVARHGL